MKIPLEHEPFAPVTLSTQQEEKLQWLSDTLLEETLQENDEFVYKNKRVLDKTRWKQVMARENLVIYKRAGKGELGATTPEVDLHASDHEPRTRYWRLPLCVGVGTLAGTLDDLLYGSFAPTSTDFKVRSSYTKDDGVDTRVIATIRKPTESDPLRLMLVRWTLLRQFVHNLGVSPREVLHLDSMGTRTLATGERIGFVVHHSLDVPGCGELTQLGLIRSSYSAVYVFRDTGYGSIEVYMRACMDPGGKLQDGVAVFSACLALISIWRSMMAGQNKKLAYMVRTNLASKVLPDIFAVAKSNNAKTCPLCLKNLPSYRSPSRCDLCHSIMCSRCVDKRKLTHVQSNGKLVRVSTVICKTCITMAAKMNARDVAASEQEPDSGRTIRFYSHDTSSSGGSQPRRSPNFMAWLARDSSFRRQSTDTISSDTTATALYTPDYGSVVSSVSMADSDFTLPSPSFSRLSTSSIQIGNVDDEAHAAVDHDKFDLWARMNHLHIATEETYQLTKQNGADGMADDGNAKGPTYKKL